MNPVPALRLQVATFLAQYDAIGMDRVWQNHSALFRDFWNSRIMAPGNAPIAAGDCDQIIRILDRNGKGNDKDSQAVARAMVPQGAWRRMLNELHSDKALGSAVDRVLNETDAKREAAAIDKVYQLNAHRRNRLTGPSGSALGAFLSAHDPLRNLSCQRSA
jgi:hypothetical protein